MANILSSKTVDLDRAQRALEQEREDARLARNNLPMFCEFFLRWQADPKRRIQLVDMHIEMIEAALKYRDLVIMASPGFGKCQATGSPVQLADGRQVPIESLTSRTKIVLFDPIACEQRTAMAGPVVDNGVRECVRVELQSGRKLTVTLNHPLWTIGGWREAGSLQTGEMVATLRHLRLTGRELDLEDETELLGYMVAEGTCKYSSPHWTNHDPELVDRMRACCTRRGWQLMPIVSNGEVLPGEYLVTGKGAALKPGAWCRIWGIAKLAKHKRIHPRIFQADEESIGKFIGALLACDGHVNPTAHSVVFNMSSEWLLKDLQQLLTRIGVYSYIRYREASLREKKFDAWQLTIGRYEDVARLSRKIVMHGPKRARLDAIVARGIPAVGKRRGDRDVIPLDWQRIHPVKPKRGSGVRPVSNSKRTARGNTRTAVRSYLAKYPCAEIERAVHEDVEWDEVVSIERLSNVQTWGIEVDDPSHCYLTDSVVSHNTNLITYALTIWEAGHRPETYTSIVGSKLTNNAYGFTRTIRSYIENNEWVRMCFPNLRPSLDRWNVEELEVSVHNKAIKDPTWKAIGNDAGWQGSRHSRQVFDDMLDLPLSRSKMLCYQQAEWVNSGYDRLDQGGKRTFIQNRFRRWDTGQILVDKYKWHLHMACIRDPVTKKTRFPEKFPQSELDNYPPTLAALHLDCIPPAEGDKIFEDSFINTCRVLGLGTTMIGMVDGELPDGVFIVHAVDPAGGPEEGSDDTAIMTGLAGPPSYFLETLPLPTEEGRRTLASLPESAIVVRVLWITKKKMGAPEIKAAIADVHRRYGGFVMVEKNGVQKWMRQLLAVEHPEIVVHSFRTGNNKHDERLGISAEANTFSVGMWVLPTRMVDKVMVSDPPIEGLIGDLADYDPSGHTPDAVSAMWILRNGVRLYKPFAYEAGMAGDQVTREELMGMGFEAGDIDYAMPELGAKANTQRKPARLIESIELQPLDDNDIAAVLPMIDTHENKMRESQARQHAQSVKALVRPNSLDDIDEATLKDVASRYF